MLVVVKKVKDYIKGDEKFNTSVKALTELSAAVEGICTLAKENAKKCGRMTVMDRDIKQALYDQILKSDKNVQS